MKYFVLFLASLFSTTLAQASYAQSDLACPTYMRLNGVPDTALPDLVEPPIAYPGAFGGMVACVLSVDGTGIGGYFAEFVPSDGTVIQDIYYKYNAILSYLQFEGENQPRNLVASCLKKDDGSLICVTDIAAGDGLRIFRFIDADLSLKAVRIVANPGSGLLNEITWDVIKDTVLTDPDTRLEIILSLPGVTPPITLPLLSDAPGEQIAYGLSGQAAYDFMVALYSSETELKVELNVYQITFNQNRKTSQERTIPIGNLRFFINHLAEIEQLFVAGYEGSKLLDFR